MAPSVQHPPAFKPRAPVPITITVAVAALALGLAGCAASAGPAPGVPTARPASQVQLEPTSSAGASPFMSPVGADQPNLMPPAGTGGQHAGDTAGLYAQAGDQPSCDSQGLLTNLQADPAKAAAWAEALGITVEGIPNFVGSLTAVLLRSDTAVTSYGYAADTFTAYPAVLQAGTAVFVNSYGEPTVKCFSGNPLTKSTDNGQGGYAGPGWAHFTPTALSYIQPTSTVIRVHTFIDVQNGNPSNAQASRTPSPTPDRARPLR